MSDVSAAQMLSENSESGQSGTGNAEAKWYSGLSEEHLEFVENKRWKDINACIQSHRNLEGMIGKDKFTRPADDDAQGWADLYGKLGRPDSAQNYKFEGQNDPEMTDWFSKLAHEAGLSQSQAAKIFASYNDMVGGISAESEEKYNAQVAADIESMKKEHGLAYDAFLQTCKKAANRFGLEKEDIDTIESSWGTKKTMDFLGKIGKSFGEDSFESGGLTDSFALSPAQAQQKISDLSLDHGFMADYLDPSSIGHKAAKEKMIYLHKFAYPEM